MRWYFFFPGDGVPVFSRILLVLRADGHRPKLHFRNVFIFMDCQEHGPPYFCSQRVPLGGALGRALGCCLIDLEQIQRGNRCRAREREEERHVIGGCLLARVGRLASRRPSRRLSKVQLLKERCEGLAEWRHHFGAREHVFSRHRFCAVAGNALIQRAACALAKLSHRVLHYNLRQRRRQGQNRKMPFAYVHFLQRIVAA
mmetsp:Transcript_72434/g.106173  ORF Transcript_72434/g.106173 Transcript_72434/m.106173 type:complete len:200 (-) Transcript_72434:138-737(-)